MLSALAGANLIYGAGMLEAGLLEEGLTGEIIADGAKRLEQALQAGRHLLENGVQTVGSAFNASGAPPRMPQPVQSSTDTW